MAGSSALLLGSSICLDSRLKLLTRAEGNHAAGADGDLFACLGVATRTLILAAEIKVAESGELDLFARRERRPQLLEEHVDELAGLTLVEPELVEQCFRNLSFGQCHVYLSRIVALYSPARSAMTRATTASVSSSVSVREISCKFKPIARLFRPVAIPPPR